MRIRIYYSPTCAFCLQAKQFFDQKGIKYEAINVLEDQDSAKDLIVRTGRTGVPVINIDGTLILGFDRKKIEEILGSKPE
ncbi:MAG: glutaredoxin domain-containing protein [Candidatus Margulisiibacteriota bacterium]